MAYPTGYTKYQEITIDHTKVSADQTDFIVYVNLADLVKAGADIFDTCRSDGGDIRATKSDGTTQLPTEVVVIDTTAKTGELHIKFSGTLSSTVDTIIRIYYNGTDTALATSDTYGRDNVWAGNYVAVWHMQEASGNITSSTGNNTATDNNTVGSATGKLGKGRDFVRASSEWFDIASGSQTGLGITGNSITMSAWIKGDASLNNLIGRIIWRLGGTGNYGYQLSTTGNVYSPNNAYLISAVGTGGGWDHSFGASGDATSGTLKHIVATYDGTNFRGYVNTSKTTSATKSNRLTSANAQTFYIGRDSTSSYYDDVLDEIRISAGVKSDSWISTEYNNQNSPSTFYASSDEQGGTTNVTASPAVLACTFSLPASTVTAVRNVSSTPTVLAGTFSLPTPAITGGSRVAPSPLVATFSLPTSNVITPNANVTPAVLVATFSLPSATVTAESNVSTSPSVLSATFSLPAPTVTLGVAITVTPDVLSATFSTPAPSVSVVSNMVASPAVLVATFSLPVARAVGDFWQNKFPVASDPFVDKVYNAGDNWSDKY